MEKHERVIKEIKFLSDAIRRKNQALRSNISEREAFLESTFKPITAPLKHISESIKRSNMERANILPVSNVKGEMDFDSDVIKQDYYNARGEKAEDFDFSKQTINPELEEDHEETVKKEGDLDFSPELEMSVEGSTEDYDTSAIEEQEETGVKTPPNRLSEIGLELSSKGPLTRKYVLKMLHTTQPKRKYHSYGARLDDGGLMVGDSKIYTDNDDTIIIAGKRFPGTRGLYELLFKKNPKSYTQRDLNAFKLILTMTNGHKKDYISNSPVHRNKSLIYSQIISKLFPSKLQKTQSGKGMKDAYKTNIIYYNNINKLVDRLRLLHEAQVAGHTGVGNEIISLTDELRRRGYIL